MHKTLRDNMCCPSPYEFIIVGSVRSDKNFGKDEP